MQIPKKFFINEKVVAFLLVLFAFFGLFAMQMQYKNQMAEIKDAILENAHDHILGILNLKTWNDFYDGIYVVKRPEIVENTYIDNDLLHGENNTTLIRINHGWMLRLLSEHNRKNKYFFKISSLHPKNPLNKAHGFEERALNFLERNRNATSYYEFDEGRKQLYYLEPLRTREQCVQCHVHDTVDGVRGGISIIHDDSYFYQERNTLLMQMTVIVIVFFGMLYFIYRIYRQLLHHNRDLIYLNETLEEKVNERTIELDEKNNYLQAVLDSSPDIILITDGEHLLSVNGSFFVFFSYESLEAFKKEHDCICDFFDKVDELHYLYDKKIEGQLWPFYLVEHPDIKHKVQMTIEGKILFFSVKARLLEGSLNKVLVEFSDITDVETQKKSFEKLAITDKLTGINNRFQFDLLFKHALSNAKRYAEPLSLLMIDIDLFKTINDRFGHDVGDKTLQHMVKTIASRLRSSDIFARWGGEEFMILLPKNEKNDAMELAESLRKSIENELFDVVETITISIGVAVMLPHDDEHSLLKRSDQALYKAKNKGRNRIEFCC